MTSVARLRWIIWLSPVLSLLTACGPSPEAATQAERAQLPQVTQIERWQMIDAVFGGEAAFAPGIVVLLEGEFRMFWTTDQGIGSATTPDGLRFNPDEGIRLGPGPEGAPDCVVSRPFVVQVINGYRMYYQGEGVGCGAPPTPGILPNIGSRIFSAFSFDGLRFQREPDVRIDLDETLIAAGQPSVIQLDDTNYRLYFTGIRADQPQTPMIFSALSSDGLAWTIDPTPVVVGGQSPTATQIENVIYLYARYGQENMLELNSMDGQTFTPTHWIEFTDAQGQPVVGFGDSDVFETITGELLIYGNGRGKPMEIFRHITESPQG